MYFGCRHYCGFGATELRTDVINDNNDAGLRLRPTKFFRPVTVYRPSKGLKHSPVGYCFRLIYNEGSPAEVY